MSETECRRHNANVRNGNFQHQILDKVHRGNELIYVLAESCVGVPCLAVRRYACMGTVPVQVYARVSTDATARMVHAGKLQLGLSVNRDLLTDVFCTVCAAFLLFVCIVLSAG